MDRYVLDSFALLAYLQAEPGGVVIKTILHEAATGQAETFISLINLGEVLYRLERQQGAGSLPDSIGLLESLPLIIAEVTRARVYAAARLKANYAISYADTFVVALAQELDAVVLTGDPEFRKLGSAVRVQWLQQRDR